MEEELLKVFNEKREQIGVASRKEVHEKGMWHETFHCWIVSENVDPVIYLQIRSPLKKDYPNLFDITAAGHLLANEEVRDGVREMEEEIGICADINDLTYLGVLHYEMVNGSLLDREFAHTYLFRKTVKKEEFLLQLEEVTGIVTVPLEDFYALWQGQRKSIEVSGYETDAGGAFTDIQKVVTQASFAPHPVSYYLELIKLMKEHVS